MIHTARAGEREKYQGVSGIHDCFDQLKRALRSLTPLVAVAGALAIGSRAVAQGAASGGAPIVDSISPDSVIEKPVPQPEIVITGSNLVVGLPSPKNRPTVTITHTELDGVSFSTQANVNFSGTQATIPGNLNHFNMLQMPLGVYDVLLSRPDGQSVTIPGGFSLTTQPEPAPGSIEMRVDSWWGGPIHGMDVVRGESGDYAYLANGRRLVVLDISDPTVPTEVGSVYLTGVYDVKVQDNYAFVAAQHPHSFCVVDVSNATAPELVWSKHSGSTSAGVELYGNYAYVRTSPIEAFDITDPLNVVSAGTIPGTSGNESWIIHESRLYVGKSSGSSAAPLRIFDLAANPIAPPLISSPERSGDIREVTSIAASGDHLYITAEYKDIKENGETDYLCTVDVNDPANPTIVNEELYNFLSYAKIAVEGDRLYLVERMARAYSLSNAQGLAIYDIGKNPSAPALITSHQTRGGVAGVLPIGETLYLWDLGEGFLIMDAADPLNLQRIGNYHSPADLRQMAKSGDHLYVADGWGGLTILNVADGAAPVVESVYLPSTEPDGYVDNYGVAERDGLIYLTLRRRLEVIDASDPETPMLVGSFHLDQVPQLPDPWDDNWIRGIAPSGTTAFLGYNAKFCGGGPLCSLYSRLLELNISNPADITFSSLTPVEYSGHTYPKNAIHAIAPIVGNPLSLPHYHYLVGNPNRIIVTDDGEEAAQLDSKQIEAEDLIVHNGLAFTAMAGPTNDPDHRGLRIEDISDPANPALLAHLNNGHRAHAVAAQNDRAYYFADSALNLINVQDPAVPIEVDVVNGVGNPFGPHLLVDEPKAFVASRSHEGGTFPANAGLVIIDIHGLEEPTTSGDLNGDGVVNVLDLLTLLGEWGECPPAGDCSADLNEDGQVNVLDLLVLLGEWG